MIKGVRVRRDHWVYLGRLGILDSGGCWAHQEGRVTQGMKVTVASFIAKAFPLYIIA